MMSQLRRILSLAGLIILASVLLYLRFPDFFHTPNRVIEPYADGFKSYTTIEYHVKYDSTYSFYQGMQYPYVEHVIPAATQPLISNTLRFIHRNITPIADKTIAIVNFSLLLSILLSAIFLYLIFRKLRLPALYAIGVSIGLSFLSPQFERLIGHYGLAHMEVIPSLIYFLMRYEERSTPWRALPVALVVTACSMIHFYFFAMQVFLITGYFFFKFLFGERTKKQFLIYIGHYVIQIGLPLVFFLLWLNSGIPVTDRTSQPWGFMVFKAEPQAIFYSQFQPYFQWLKVSKWGMEHRAYIGLFAFFGGILMLLRYLTGRFKRKLINWGTAYDSFFIYLFGAAVLILLFSFGLPFVWKDKNLLLDYAGPLRQFRAIGRFAWVFYYVINILVFTGFYYFFVVGKGISKWRLALLILPVLWVNYEAYNYVWSFDLRLNTVSSMKKGHTYLDIPDINYEDYQAIISLPDFSIGSDNFWRHPDGAVAQESQVLSIQTGLPLNSAMLTRTSLSNTIKELQLTSEPYRYPLLLQDLEDRRPFIIVTSKVGLKKMAKKGFVFDHLLADATFLFSKSENTDVLSLPFDSFKKRLDAKRASVRAALTNKDALFERKNLWVSDSTGFYYYDAFDTQDGMAYQGRGGYEGMITNDNRILETVIPAGDYFFTGWFYVQHDLFPRTIMTLEVKNKAGKILFSKARAVGDIVKTFDNNGWALLQLPFRVKESDATVSVRFANDNSMLKGEKIGFDELLIYPRGSHAYWEREGWKTEDNRWFRY